MCKLYNLADNIHFLNTPELIHEGWKETVTQLELLEIRG